MRDLIDRQAAIDTLNDDAELLRRALEDVNFVGAEREKYEWGLGLIESNISDMKELPSAQHERKRGRFIKELIPYEGRRTITCSECGKELSTGPEVGVNYFRRGWRYCPYCGARMDAEGEE